MVRFRTQNGDMSDEINGSYLPWANKFIDFPFSSSGFAGMACWQFDHIFRAFSRTSGVDRIFEGRNFEWVKGTNFKKSLRTLAK